MKDSTPVTFTGVPEGSEDVVLRMPCCLDQIDAMLTKRSAETKVMSLAIVRAACAAACCLVCAFAFGQTSAAPSNSNPPTVTVVDRRPGEKVKAFLRRHRPRGATRLVHHTPSHVRIQGESILVGVYRGSFDGKGNPYKGEWSNQFSFAFLRSKDGRYRRVPVTDLGDQGGSPMKVLAVFTTRLDKSSPERQLAFLTRWDSRRAGGRAVSLVLGIHYAVKAVRFASSPSPAFERLRSPMIDKLGGCDCTHFKRVAGKQTVVRVTKARARDVRGIRKQLRFF